MAGKIVINTIGTLGDLHPLMAVAQALKANGMTPVFAVSKDYLDKIRMAGFEAHGIAPGHLQIARDKGHSEEEFMTKLMTNQVAMMREFVLEPLSETCHEMNKIMEEADAVLGTVFSYAGLTMANKFDVPFILAALQPGVLITKYDPMITPEFPVFISDAQNRLSQSWNRIWVNLFLFMGSRLFGNKLNSVRAEFDLPRKPKLPTIQPEDTPLILGLYSDVLGAIQPDYYPQTHITGFPVFDSLSGAPERLDPALNAFLEAGPPPLVFSVGSVAFHAAKEFYRDSAKLASAMGRRAVLLTGKDMGFISDDQVFAAYYAPHSQLFPRAAAIIHHGGIGSTGQALMAGKPQLIVPFNGDQFDNARRVHRLGISQTLKAKSFSAKRAKPLLTELLENRDILTKAQTIGQQVASENGADKAADMIIAFMRGR